MERESNHQNEEYAKDSEMNPFVTWRPRRALPREYFIEIMVVADAKMVEYHSSGLTSYILVLMSTVGIYFSRIRLRFCKNKMKRLLQIRNLFYTHISLL